ncbi:MAG: 6,7-dimethyl-8-ribityllumazine synthase [Desulfarculales bacterium]|jgi:6,7-dimethyl-8-ribityllumazine synthase|nr:6,7-dimethyl-8-ribityllumazine synthase [Desulfarculales bacterium]
MKVLEGHLKAEGMRFALVVSRFNEFISSRLLEGASDALRRHGANMDDCAAVWVPGAFEIPFTAQALAQSKKYDAVITLGAVIRGATPHFDMVAGEVTKGVAQAGLSSGVPVIFGVLTTDSIEQAIERAGSKGGNKGADAALAAIEMVDMLRRI